MTYVESAFSLPACYLGQTWRCLLGCQGEVRTKLRSPPRNDLLEARARKYTSPYRDVIRAKIILMAAQGLPNDVIGSHLDTPRQIVSKWRKRFYEHGFPGLEEEPRGGAPARF